MTSAAVITEETGSATSVLAGYKHSMSGAPLLGHVVLYSVYDGRVRPSVLAGWWSELGLDPALLPPDPRADVAFTTAAGRTKTEYALRAPEPALIPAAPPGRPSRRQPPARTVTLMIRRVARDRDAILCHLVREVRDTGRKDLTYSDRIAEITFTRDRNKNAPRGAGTMSVVPHWDTVPQDEHEHVDAVLTALYDDFTRNRDYHNGDKVRSAVCAYIGSLNAVKVRPSGGAYFVYAEHADTLDAISVLLSRFGHGSDLYRLPLPDEPRHRKMVITHWREETRQAVQALSQEIADAQASARSTGIKTPTVQRLYRQYIELKARADQHGSRLGSDLDDMTAAMSLAADQLDGLFENAA